MRRRDGERGQSLVEFALVLPLLALFLLGIFDFGRIYFAQLTVSEAARDAARYASIGNDDNQLQQVISDDTGSLRHAANWSVTPDPARTSGDTVEVTVSSPVDIIDPLFAAILGSSFTVTSTVSMRVE